MLQIHLKMMLVLIEAYLGLWVPPLRGVSKIRGPNKDVPNSRLLTTRATRASNLQKQSFHIGTCIYVCVCVHTCIYVNI